MSQQRRPVKAQPLSNRALRSGGQMTATTSLKLAATSSVTSSVPRVRPRWHWVTTSSTVSQQHQPVKARPSSNRVLRSGGQMTVTTSLKLAATCSVTSSVPRVRPRWHWVTTSSTVSQQHQPVKARPSSNRVLRSGGQMTVTTSLKLAATCSVTSSVQRVRPR